MGQRVAVVWMTGAALAVVLVSACGSSSKSPGATATSSTAPESTSASASQAPSTTTSVSVASTTTVVTTNFNSCSVVTQAEAASAIGQTVTSGILGNATVEGGLACVFYGPSAPSSRNPNVAQPDSVRVVVVEGPDAMTWYNDYKSKVNAQPVTGYGDQAYWDGDASLSVLKGDSYLRVAVAPGGAPPSLSDEKQLATAILPKL
jgi:hypothetical protein